MWKDKRPRTANAIFETNSKVGGLLIPKFKTFYKTTVINIAQYVGKNRQIIKRIKQKAQKQIQKIIVNLNLKKEKYLMENVQLL